MKHTMAIAAGCLLLLPPGLPAAVFNVTNSGEFQAALDTAQANGEADTINVAAGTYNLAAPLTYCGPETEDFDLTIVGAGSATTILDGDDTVQVMRITNDGNSEISISGLTFQHGRVGSLEEFGAGLYVLNSGGGSTLIDHCVATLCTAIRNTAGAWLGTQNGDITVTDSEFTHNTCDDGTSDDGCGLYLYFDSATATGSAIVRNNVISYNTLNTNPSPVGNCDGAGAMIYHLGTNSTAPSITVENNTISNNLSYEGSCGMSIHVLHQQAIITFTGNTFQDNTAGPIPPGVPIQIGGAGLDLYCDGGTVVVNNNRFLGNRNLDPNGQGAGLSISNLPTGTLLMTGNVFAGNQCSGIGGGAMVNPGNGATSATIAGNLFVNNQAGLTAGSGGGLSISSGIDITLANNTFYNNTAADGGGMTYYAEAGADVASLANSIFRGNTPNAISVFSLGPVAATYSNIQGGTGEPWFGTGCIDADPLFFDAASPAGADGIYATTDDGLHLTAASPSANTGSDAAIPAGLVLDLAGQARIQGAAVDMGAYEGNATEPVPHLLTLATDPIIGGDTVPAAGVHSLTSPQAIQANPAAGYYFDQWTAIPVETVIQSATSANTTVGFATDCTVTAHFVEILATATLTVAINPAGGGTTTPAVGEHAGQDTEVAIPIVATPAEGYGFVNWTASRHLTLGSALAMTTTVTMVADGTVTANFAPLPNIFTVAPGSLITLAAEDVDDDVDGNPFGEDQFPRKPKLFGTYYDPIKDPDGARLKRATIKVAYNRDSPAAIEGTWTKKICLFNKRAIQPGQDAATYLPLVQQDALTMENLWVAVRNAEDNDGPFDGGELTLVPPAITGIYPDATVTPGTEIDVAAAGDIIYLQGTYFGTKAPKVWLEYPVVKAAGPVIKAKACKIQKPLAFPDAKGNAGRSCMDLDDNGGDSLVAVQMPTAWPNGWDHGEAHNLVIDNGIGRATIDFGTEAP